MPNQPSSYKKLFSRFSTTNDKIEKDVIEKIKNDYEKYHKHDLKMFEDIFVMNEIVCPICNSKKIKVHGYDKNRIKDLNVMIVVKHLIDLQIHYLVQIK